MEAALWKLLFVSGPLAAVLGYAVRVLWKKIQALERKLDAERKRHEKRVETLHHEYVETIKEWNRSVDELVNGNGNGEE